MQIKEVRIINQYCISGTTFSGVHIDEVVEAASVASALRVIFQKYRERLRKPYNLFRTSRIDDISQIPKGKVAPSIEPLLPETDVLRIGGQLKSGLSVSKEEQSLFWGYFRPLVRSAVRFFWRDMTIATPEDKEQEMYKAIIDEFLPTFSPERGKLLQFIKGCVQRRLMRDWSKEIYINAGKSTARPKHELLKEYTRHFQQQDVPLSVDDLIRVCIKIIEEDIRLDMHKRRDLFKWIVRLGLHREYIRFPKQVEALELIYGKNPLTECTAAEKLEVSQQTLNRNKCRGEKSFFKYIKKNYMG